MNIEHLVMFGRHQAEFEESRIAADRCVRGRPLQRTWHHFTSADERFFAGTWEAEPGCWRVSYTEDEYCEILSGRSVLRDEAGNEVSVEAGDRFVIPAGFTGQWEVIETTRKVYVIYQP